MDLGAAYCSKECSKMDKLMSLANKSSPSISASALTPASASASSMKRFAHSPMTVTYPSMFKSSTLVPSSVSSRGGISKSAYTPIPAATTSIRCLPASRSAVRRQPLVLFDWAVSYRPWSPFVNQEQKRKTTLPLYRLIFLFSAKPVHPRSARDLLTSCSLHVPSWTSTFLSYESEPCRTSPQLVSPYRLGYPSERPIDRQVKHSSSLLKKYL